MKRLIVMLGVLSAAFGGQSVMTKSQPQAESFLRFMAQERGCVVNSLTVRLVEDAYVGAAVYDCRENVPLYAIAA